MKASIYLIIPLLFFQNGLGAQVTDTSAIITPQKISFKPPRIKTKLFYAPSLLVIAGVAANGNNQEGFKKEIAEERNEHFSGFHTSVDNYLQFSPIAIAYGLDALGYKSKNDLPNKTAILLKGELAMTGVVFGLKTLTHQLRPDRSSYTSFPSGHTAQAFAAATFLSEEYKDRLHWMPWLAYGLASTVGVLRMANNKHYVSDVLVGAGIGILSMKMSYATHRYKWGKKQQEPPGF